VLLVKASATHSRLPVPEGARLTALVQRQIDSLLDEIAATRFQQHPSVP